MRCDADARCVVFEGCEAAAPDWRHAKLFLGALARVIDLLATLFPPYYVINVINSARLKLCKPMRPSARGSCARARNEGVSRRSNAR